MVATPTVYVVDDDAAIRTSLQLLCGTVGLPVRAFASAQQYLDEYDAESRGCIILDLRMPGGNGLGMLERLREYEYHMPVIVLTAHGTVPHAVRAMKQGAIDFLEKTVDDQELLDKIQQAIELDAANHVELEKCREFRERQRSLTDREREVMDFVVDGMSSKDIASELGISFKTIEAHRARIMKKMGARSVTHLIRGSFETKSPSDRRSEA